MEIGNVSMMQQSTMQASSPAYQVGASGDNEAIERVPDNEQAEIAAQSSSKNNNTQAYSLAPWQGGTVDMMA